MYLTYPARMNRHVAFLVPTGPITFHCAVVSRLSPRELRPHPSSGAGHSPQGAGI
jgi:hypothetical protein